jgi:DNA-binding NtrC family response regulator
VPIHLPPLRDRPEDIAELVGHFLTYYNEENDRYVTHIEPKALAALQNYHFPGNVRELQNFVERAVVMATGDELTCELLPDSVLKGPQTQRTPRARVADLETLTYELVQQGLASAGPQEDNLHAKVVNRVERELIAQVMTSCDSVQTKAATKLGINRNTLHKKLKEYGFDGEPQ